MRLANRRGVLGLGASAALTALIAPAPWAEASAEGLSSMTTGVQPISVGERQGRIAKAQGLMRRQGVSALLVEAGSSLIYFTGIDWWRSERLTAAILPVEGEALVVTPFFEEPSIRETLAIPADVRVWQEDESPAALMAAFLRERKLDRGTLAVEETVRYFAVDHLQSALPELKVTSGAPIVRPLPAGQVAGRDRPAAALQRHPDRRLSPYRAQDRARDGPGRHQGDAARRGPGARRSQ